MLNNFLSDLRQFIPSERIYTDELRTLGWGTDASFYRQIPKVVLRSDGEEEISKIVRLCQKYKLPFTFRAAGTSLSGQSCTDSVIADIGLLLVLLGNLGAIECVRHLVLLIGHLTNIVEQSGTLGLLGVQAQL